MKLHIVMHESYEAPAAIETWVINKGYEITYTRLYQGDIFPVETKSFDFLVVMGGPQSPATTIQECPHFDAQKEELFIKKAIDENKFLLGICLGAQLIGEALGAKFDHSPNREIGVFNLNLTDSASTDPVFSSFPKVFPVGHWHGDMPGFTSDSALLAYSDGCPRQIVRYSPKIYGFQCHFEFNKESIEGMIQNCGHELLPNKPYIESADKLRQHDYNSMNNLLYKFLDYFDSEFKKSSS